MSEAATRDRFRGCLLGLAAGDALGTTLEFKRPGSFEPIDDTVGGGQFCLQPGQWTDDTSMALCLATSGSTSMWTPPASRSCTVNASPEALASDGDFSAAGFIEVRP